MNRRDLLRRGGLVAVAAIVAPTEEFVRRFFPVGIDLKQPRRIEYRVPPGYTYSVMHQGRMVPLVVREKSMYIVVPA